MSFYVNQLTKPICRKYSKSIYPNFTPVINSLSITTSKSNVYTVVNIIGDNFSPYDTYVNFGPYKNIEIVFISSLQISFIVPINSISGNYSVVVVNVYNSNLSKKVNFTYSNNLIYSNSVNYTIT